MADAAVRADALRAWFLGPRAENAALLERLVVESLRDHVFWRRNYHPEDGFTIRESDKRREGYEDAVATLTQELLGLLAELKRDVPVFSGRYKGHMLAEQTIAAQVGWFATMLYNPNNIATDISPVTTRLEMEVAAQLARMIGYDPRTSWGHLTSGGTIANFEAFWLARGVRYLAVAAAGAAAELGARAAGHHGGRHHCRTHRALAVAAAQRPQPRRARPLGRALGGGAARRCHPRARQPLARGDRVPGVLPAARAPSTAIRSRRAWCWSRRRRTTPGRRSSVRSASDPTSWCTCRWTPGSGWIPTRCGTRCGRSRADGRRSSPA